MFIYLAYEGVKSCRKHGHDTVFEVAYYGYFLVGLGSFMFHSTLKCWSIDTVRPGPQADTSQIRGSWSTSST